MLSHHQALYRIFYLNKFYSSNCFVRFELAAFTVVKQKSGAGPCFKTVD